MSTPVPVSSYTPEEFEREFGTEDTRPVPTARAAAALTRSAGEQFAVIYEEPPAVRADVAPASLERVGCNFIDMTYQLLDYANAPAEVREVVMIISGLAGGNYSEFTEIPRTRIAQRMGLSSETVRQRIEALWDWQRRTNKTVVEIDEQERDPNSRKFLTTKYRPIIVRYAGNFIRKLEARGMRPIHRQQAIEAKLESVYEEVAFETIDEMPDAPLLRRRESKNVTPRQQKLTFIEGKKERMRRAVLEYRDALTQAGYSAQDYANEISNEVYQLMSAR